ncbi:MAG: hypothetical protein AAB131_06020 [Actinomycetota bacterium]
MDALVTAKGTSTTFGYTGVGIDPTSDGTYTYTYTYTPAGSPVATAHRGTADWSHIQIGTLNQVAPGAGGVSPSA